MAGYSGTPLATKLGIKDGSRVAMFGAPDDVRDEIGVDVATAARGTFDVVVSFHDRRADLERRMPTLVRVLDVDGGLWMAWPKKASGVPTDLTEDVHRSLWLPFGLVDNKVCAINEVWSGLRFVWRKELRASRR